MKKKYLMSVLLIFSIVTMAQNNQGNNVPRQGNEVVQSQRDFNSERPNGDGTFSGFPGGPGGFPGGPGGFQGGPGGFPGPWMMGGMGSIDQFGVEFHDAFLEEDESSKSIADAMSNDSSRMYFVENQHFTGKLRICFDGNNTTIEGSCPNGVKVSHRDGDVVIYCKGKAMELEFTGISDDGSIDIKSDSPVKIIFNGLSLRSQKGEAVKINTPYPTYIELASGSDNRLEDRFKEVDREGRWSFAPRPVESDYETEVIDGIEMRKSVNRAKVKDESPKVSGVLTSEGTLCFSGHGRLRIKGHNKSGIKSKGHMVFRAGNVINVEVTQGKGISAKGDIRILGGVLNIDGSDSGEDGLRCDGSMYIDGGWTVVKCGGGESSEGIESKYNVEISGGTVEVASYDDAINSGGNLIVWGGKVFAASVMNDALDSNSNLLISGGYVVALGGNAPECGLDSNEEEGFSLYINGGVVFASGGMPTRTSDKSRQNSLIYNVEKADSGMVFCLSSGERPIQSFGLVRSYPRGGSLLFSSPLLKTGNSYEILLADERSASAVISGFHNTSDILTSATGDKLESVEKLEGPLMTVGKRAMMFGPPMPPVQQ